MWVKTIETAPKNRPILIREKKGYMPDFVRWQLKRPEKVVAGNRHCATPEGWFRLFGGRSHILKPKEWVDVPD